MAYLKVISSFFFVWCGFLLHAQETVVSGKISDAKSGDPIPFATVIFKGTTIGTSTDFEGRYRLKITQKVDSLIISSIGYLSRSKAVQAGITQEINFQLEEAITSLSEVVVVPGENPAWPIMRKMVKNKEVNDKRNLSAYEYDAYTKVEIDADNISEKIRKRKIMKKISAVLDSIDRIAGDDGKPILPLLISESISKIYYRNDPSLKTEVLQKTKVNGVGVEEGSLTTQILGSTFQEYNFYQNWLNIVSKDFVSPLADGWRVYYDYYLIDSIYVGNDYCYQIDFYPKNPKDLAFTGTMWITKNEFALRQIDATIGQKANVNFLERIKIQQELQKTNEGPWIPIKNRVLVDLSEVTKNSLGMLAKFYTHNKNIVTNRPKDQSFYQSPIQSADVQHIRDEKVWDTLRYEKLSATEQNVVKMIDTLKNIPVVKTYTDIIKILLDGYYDLGKIELGPYPSFFAINNIEGLRAQVGFKTNYNFSKKWIYSAWGAYGFADQKIKYKFQVQHIISTDHWTELSFRVKHDIARLGVDEETVGNNPLFMTAMRWGTFRRAYYFDEAKISLQRELFKGFTQKVSFRHVTFEPTYNFGFYESADNLSLIKDFYRTTEVTVESRYARDEIFIRHNNERTSLGVQRSPVITLRYTKGIQGIANSDFNYDKVKLSISKRIKLGPLGYGYANLSGEYIFNKLPYPLLAVHLGNQTSVYTDGSNNLMTFGEFVSDHYASFRYRQYLESFFTNRIPLIKKLNWRIVAHTNILFGGMRQENQNLISTLTKDGLPTLPVGSLMETKPYIEAGYGVENILKFLRVDFIHRLSYLDRPNVRSFGVFLSAQFKL